MDSIIRDINDRICFYARDMPVYDDDEQVIIAWWKKFAIQFKKILLDEYSCLNEDEFLIFKLEELLSILDERSNFKKIKFDLPNLSPTTKNLKFNICLKNKICPNIEQDLYQSWTNGTCKQFHDIPSIPICQGCFKFNNFNPCTTCNIKKCECRKCKVLVKNSKYCLNHMFPDN